MTKQLSSEQLALYSYVEYYEYAKEVVGRTLTTKEYSSLMESYINSVPVIDAVKKLEDK